MRTLVVPGATTMDLERAAEKKMKDAGREARPSKGYYDYPCVLCTSINEEIVHGIPSEKRMLNAGDIVSVDCGVVLDGYYGDAAITVPVGEEVCARVAEAARRLPRSFAVPRNREGAHRKFGRRRGRARCRSTWKPTGFSVVREFVGHGIGTKLHEEPQVPNYRSARAERRACGKAWCSRSSRW